MNAIAFDIIWGLAMLAASLISAYIVEKCRGWRRRRTLARNPTDDRTSAAAATTSVATLESTATSLADTTARLEATVTLFNNRVTQEQPREDPALVVESSNHSTITEEAELVRLPTGERPIVALPQAEGMAPAPSNLATYTSPTHVLDHSQLRRRKPLIDDAEILALRDPQSPFHLTNRLNRSGSRKLRLLLAVGVVLLLLVLLLVVHRITASLKFWNVPRQTAKVDAATGGEPEVATHPVGLPAAPTSLHLNGVDGRKVVLPFPSSRKPIFVLSPGVQKVPCAYVETWFRAVESLLMMVCSRELDLQTRKMDSIKRNLFPDTLGQKTVEDHTCSGDHTDCDSMNQIKMVFRGFSTVPRQTSKVDAAARGAPAVATPPVGLPVAPTSLHFDVGGRGLDLPFPTPGKPIFVLSPEVQEVSRSYVETWYQAVESLLMMVCSYGSSNTWRDRFIGLGPEYAFCFFHPNFGCHLCQPVAQHS